MKTGILGGSGLYDMEALTDVEYEEVATPFGAPSDAYVHGRLGGDDVVFLPRHGRGHRLTPSEINYRANVYGLKMLGVGRVISISAVGSLREEMRPRDIVLPDQYFDRTKRAGEATFFGDGIVAHISFAEPACPVLRGILADAAREIISRSGNGAGPRLHERGTYVNMEGPAFSTKAESEFYRKMEFDVIGMTSLTEAKLCREAGMCYQAVAMVTDYDCWRETGKAVTVEMIIEHLKANTGLAKKLIAAVLPRLPEERAECGCARSLKDAIITDRNHIPDAAREKLRPIIDEYI